MSRKPYTGEQRLWWVTTIANRSAPTVAEINAGIDVTPQMRRSGFTRPQAGSTIDAADGASRFNKTVPGNYGGDQVSFPGIRDSVAGSENAYTTLVRDAAGHFVYRPFGGSAVAVAAGQKVEVWSGTIISREDQPSGDDVQNYMVAMSVEQEPAYATVAA